MPMQYVWLAWTLIGLAIWLLVYRWKRHLRTVAMQMIANPALRSIAENVEVKLKKVFDAVR
jgi:hypothetical protein